MKTLNKYLLLIITFYALQSSAQTPLPGNDFRIGEYMFAFSYDNTSNPAPCNLTISANNTSGYPSSSLSVLAQDGFNTVDDYTFPSLYMPVDGMIRGLELVENINNSMNTANNTNYIYLKMQTSCKDYFKPWAGAITPGYQYLPSLLLNNILTSASLNGSNDYVDSNYLGENNPFNIKGNTATNDYCVGVMSRPDYQTLFTQVFTGGSNPSGYTLQNYIWGHSINEEGCYNHGYVYSDRYDPAKTTVSLPVPVQNVSSATGYFRNFLKAYGITNQKMTTVQANHGKSINNNTQEEATAPVLSKPQDYINPSLCTNMPDVFFESSYYQFPTTNWYTFPYSNIATGNDYHYLGKFKSIDYALTKVSNVQSMCDLGSSAFSNNSAMNSGSVQNANYFWLLLYGSIIHGASGVWMYGATQSFYSQDPGDVTAQTNYSNMSNAQRFIRPNFPYIYQNYAGQLSREFAYLVNNNIVSTDPGTVICKKTDEADPYCIVPAATSYITDNLLSTNKVPKDVYTWASFLGINYVTSTYTPYPDLETENYGLRYTIRSYGNRTVMIICNMLPIPLETTLDFSNLANPVIRNADQIKVLYESSFPSLAVVSSSTYKTNRDSKIDLVKNTVGKLTFANLPANKQITMAFGPLDTHVIEFEKAVMPEAWAYANDYANGWARVWSNNGSDWIGNWHVLPTDEYLTGDFLNDGTQQLLCIDKSHANGGYATLYKYNATTNNWDEEWSNNGNGTIGGWIMHSTDQYVSGNFTGTGKYDQLLISNTNTRYATLTEISGTKWNSDWNNAGNGFIGTWAIGNADRFITGDWLHSTGRKDLLCIQNQNTNAGAQIITFSSGKWNFSWTNSASGKIGNWTINTTDKYAAGDLNGTGFTDRLITSNYAISRAEIENFSSGTWSQNYTSTGNIAGVGIPQTDDALLVGNLNNSSNGDDMFFIQGTNTSGANYATTVDLVSGTPTWKWSNHDAPWVAPENGFINDWPVADPSGSIAKYLLIKPIAGGPAYLLAMRSYGCTAPYLVNMYKTYINNCSSCGDFSPIKPADQDNSIMGSVDMKVYPNPNRGIYTIEIDNNNDNTANIEVYNIFGQMVKSVENYKLTPGSNNLVDIDMSNAPTGQYIVKCTTDSGVKVSRVTIAK
jgi:hypothetical protein